MQIDNIKTELLIPYARNSRTHPEEQISQIMSSINEFGFTNPILIDNDGMIIAGHGRLMAAQRLHIDTVPCIRLGHLSEAQKKAYVIADNKIAMNAGWDEEMLSLELQDLQELDFDIDLLGFDDDDMDFSFEGDGGHDSGSLDSEKYTTKTETPIYEIKGDKPEIEEVYSTEKTLSLIDKIEKVDMPDDMRDFLISAATRHTVYNYANIAELYAHQGEEIKDLMRQSALVIIDYEMAIEEGYVKLSKDLMALRRDSDEG